MKTRLSTNRPAYFSAGRLIAFIASLFLLNTPVQGQANGSTVSGKITESTAGKPMVGASVTIEGTRLGTRTDSLGDYEIRGVPGGPHVLRAQRIGYSPTRKNIDVSGIRAATQDLEMARSALQLKGVQVTADPRSRARGGWAPRASSSTRPFASKPQRVSPEYSSYFLECR